MKIVKQISLTLLIVISFTLRGVSQSKEDCVVLLPKISGTYNGECKKGKAHGEGKSVGEDTYEGEFKKGFPDGKGKYIWSNGSFYEGEWKNGIKNGQGKLVIKTDVDADSVLIGFWKDDEYIGKYETPYKVESKSTNVNKIRFTKQALNPNQIEIKVTRQNQKIGYSNLKVSIGSEQYYSDKITISEFPVELNIEFDAASASGLGVAKEKIICKVKVMESGSWQIIIDLTKV